MAVSQQSNDGGLQWYGKIFYLVTPAYIFIYSIFTCSVPLLTDCIAAIERLKMRGMSWARKYLSNVMTLSDKPTLF